MFLDTTLSGYNNALIIESIFFLTVGAAIVY